MKKYCQTTNCLFLLCQKEIWFFACDWLSMTTWDQRSMFNHQLFNVQHSNIQHPTPKPSSTKYPQPMTQQHCIHSICIHHTQGLVGFHLPIVRPVVHTKIACAAYISSLSCPTLIRSHDTPCKWGVTVTLKEILPSATTKNTDPDLYLFFAGLLCVIFSRVTVAEFAGWSSCQAWQPKIVSFFLADISCNNTCTGWALNFGYSQTWHRDKSHANL